MRMEFREGLPPLRRHGHRLGRRGPLPTGFERSAGNSQEGGPGAARPQIRRFYSQRAEAIDRAPAPEARGLRSEALATPNLYYRVIRKDRTLAGMRANRVLRESQNRN